LIAYVGAGYPQTQLCVSSHLNWSAVSSFGHVICKLETDDNTTITRNQSKSKIATHRTRWPNAFLPAISGRLNFNFRPELPAVASKIDGPTLLSNKQLIPKVICTRPRLKTAEYAAHWTPGILSAVQNSWRGPDRGTGLCRRAFREAHIVGDNDAGESSWRLRRWIRSPSAWR